MSKKITKRGRYIMKVLMLNGSPRTKGNTFIALEEMKKVFEVEGVEAEIVQVGNKDVRGCIACRRCVELGKCVFDDVVNELDRNLKKRMELWLPVRYILLQRMLH